MLCTVPGTESSVNGASVTDIMILIFPLWVFGEGVEGKRQIGEVLFKSVE